MPTCSAVLARLAAAALALAPVAAPAQDAPGFDLQLNSAADTAEGACRLTYVAANRSENVFDRAAFQVGIFDTEGTVTRLLVLDFGALTAGKTKILQFDLSGTPCASISRILVNQKSACTLAGGAESDFCFAELVASSRISIQFGT